MNKEKKIKQYSAKDLEALTPEQHLRSRPNLTFGDERGNEEYPYSSMGGVAVREILDNSIAEVAIGVADRIRVTFYQDESVKIEDNGRGIPTDVSKDAYGNNINGIYKALGLLQSGSALKGVQFKKYTTSQNGVGGSSTNHISEWFKVKVYRDNKIYALDFKEGIPGLFDENGKFKEAKDKVELFISKDGRTKEEKKLFPHGSSVHFKLDKQYFFVPYGIDVEDIRARVKGSAYLFPKTTFEFSVEEKDGTFTSEIYSSRDGIKELVDLTVANDITEIIEFDGNTAFLEKGGKSNDKVKGLSGQKLLKELNKLYKENDLLQNERELNYKLAFNYNSGYDYLTDTYVNAVRTTLGGVHLQAVEKALLDSFNKKFRSMKTGLNAKDPDVMLRDVQEGLTLILAIETNVPRFVGQEKQLLGGKELQKALYDDLCLQLDNWLNKGSNRDTVETLATKIITAMKNRTKAQEQLELNREKKKLIKSSKMPTKLLDCEITHDDDSELYLCEGDSALSGLKGARSSKNQALFPLRGKMLNMLKAGPKEILNNKELQDIIKCLDAGVGEEFNLEEARYKKVFIACDSDPDGQNIACLILVAMWKAFPSLVLSGNLYKVITPLYEIRTNNGIYFAKNNADYKVLLEELQAKKVKVNEVVRMKGLGEGSKETLAVTGMNPQTRRIERVTVEDIKAAEEMLEVVMGSDVAPRREWIESHNLMEVGE